MTYQSSPKRQSPKRAVEKVEGQAPELLAHVLTRELKGGKRPEGHLNGGNWNASDIEREERRQKESKRKSKRKRVEKILLLSFFSMPIPNLK